MYTQSLSRIITASNMTPMRSILHGMPAENLLRYYGCDSGPVGAAVATFPDLSGNAAEAALFQGSGGVSRTLGGVANDDSQGFAFDTGVSMTGQVTMVVATRCTVVPDDANFGHYVMFAGPSERVIAPLTAVQQVYSPGPWLMTDPYPTDGVGNVWAYSGGGATWESTGNTSNRLTVANDVSDPDAYRVSVLSWDTDSGVLRFISTNGSTVRDVVESTILADLAALDTTLMMGVFQRAQHGAAGELCLGAVYSGLMSIEQMQAHAGYARDVVAARGVTVL